MKYFIVICCVLASALAKDKKISLEDIERDNLKPKATRTVPQKVTTPPNYGFVPTRTASDYARQQPKYVQYVPPQQYTPPQQQYQQYYYQQQQPNPYQQYENVQYVTDNNVAAQQYYTPQYVYLQQYTAPSTAVQTVVDPKGGIQYVMYVPTYIPKAEQTQNYESVVYANDQQYVIPESQYVQQQQATPDIKYVQEAPKTQVYVKPEPAAVQSPVYAKQEPKSLLDSYIPSILQVQYYKEQQARANAIQSSLKEVSSPVPGKSNYRSQQAETVVNYQYQIPNTQQKYN